MLKVKLNNKSLGLIEDWFIQKLSFGDTFLFGGKILKFESITMDTVLVKSSKAKNPKIPSYAGGRMPLSTKLSKRVLDFLNDDKQWKVLPKNILSWLEFQKKKSIIPPNNTLMIEYFKKKNKNISEHFYIFIQWR